MKDYTFKLTKLKLLLFKLFGKKVYGKDCADGICCEVFGYRYKGKVYLIKENCIKKESE